MSYNASQEALWNSPEVVTTDETLKTCAKIGGAEVLAELDRLIHAAVAVSEVGALRSSKVDVKTFFRTILRCQAVLPAR